MSTGNFAIEIQIACMNGKSIRPLCFKFILINCVCWSICDIFVFRAPQTFCVYFIVYKRIAVLEGNVGIQAAL